MPPSTILLLLFMIKNQISFTGHKLSARHCPKHSSIKKSVIPEVREERGCLLRMVGEGNWGTENSFGFKCSCVLSGLREFVRFDNLWFQQQPRVMRTLNGTAHSAGDLFFFLIYLNCDY